MYGDLSYQYTKCHLLRINIQQLDVYVKDVAKLQYKTVPPLIQEDVDKFMSENKEKSSEVKIKQLHISNSSRV
jgi:hypothetical protein